jgi:hypothetical protein
VFDPTGLAALFRQLVGRRLAGAVDCDDATELVFSGGGLNLVTVYTDGRFRGRVVFGAVSDPERYVGP